MTGIRCKADQSDTVAASLRDLRFHRAQPATIRLHTALARLLARHCHDLYRSFVFPQDT